VHRPPPVPSAYRSAILIAGLCGVRFSSAGRKRITIAKSHAASTPALHDAEAARLRAWSRAYCTRKRLAADHAAASQLIPLECGSIAERSGPK